MRETILTRALAAGFVRDCYHELPGPDTPTKAAEWETALRSLMSQYAYAAGDTRATPARLLTRLLDLSVLFYDTHFPWGPYYQMPTTRWQWLARIARLVHIAATPRLLQMPVGLALHYRLNLVEVAQKWPVFIGNPHDHLDCRPWNEYWDKIPDNWSGYNFERN